MVNYSELVENLGKVLACEETVFVDVETTGLSGSDEVVEVGVLNHVGDVLVNALCSPSVPMSEGARRVNGLSEEVLRGAKPFLELYPCLDRIWGRSRFVVGWNVDFDRRLLDQTCRRYSLGELSSYSGVYWKDGIGVCKKLLPVLSSYSLENVVRYLGLEVGENHRAVHDARLVRAVLAEVLSLKKS